jgi:hypothetical protein
MRRQSSGLLVTSAVGLTPSGRLCGPISQAKLCGVPMYASAQSLDFLAMTKNCSFPNRKQLISHPEFPDGNYLMRKGE